MLEFNFVGPHRISENLLDPVDIKPSKNDEVRTARKSAI